MEEKPELVYYYTGYARRDSDDSVGMKISIYAEDHQGTGIAVFKPDHSDYDLWVWLASRTYPSDKPWVRTDQIEGLLDEFQPVAERFRAEPATRQQLLDTIPYCWKPTDDDRRREKINGFLAWLILIPYFIFIMPFTLAYDIIADNTWRKRRRRRREFRQK